jgi:hypothetical protein
VHGLLGLSCSLPLVKAVRWDDAPAKLQRIAERGLPELFLSTLSRVFPFVDRLPIKISRHVNFPRARRRIIDGHNFLGHPVAPFISLFRDFATGPLAPFPAARHGCPVAGAIQYEFFGRAIHCGYQVRPIAIGTQRDQISSAALRTLYAMANTRHEDNGAESRWLRNVATGSDKCAHSH